LFELLDRGEGGQPEGMTEEELERLLAEAPAEEDSAEDSYR
jgi:hypothetical protein